MNEESFYVGLGMLFAPVLVYLVSLLIQSQIDWEMVGISILCIAYFGTALFLLIKGAVSDE